MCSVNVLQLSFVFYEILFIKQIREWVMLKLNIDCQDLIGKALQIDVQKNATVKQLKYLICSMISYEPQDFDLTSDQRSLDDNQLVEQIYKKGNTVHCRRKKGPYSQHDTPGSSTHTQNQILSTLPSARTKSNPVSQNQSLQPLGNKQSQTLSTLKVEIVKTQSPKSNESKAKAMVSFKHDVLPHEVKSLNPKFVPPSTANNLQQNNSSITKGNILISCNLAQEDQQYDIFKNIPPSQRNPHKKEQPCSLNNQLAPNSHPMIPTMTACLSIYPTQSIQPNNLPKDAQAQSQKAPIIIPQNTKPVNSPLADKSKSNFLQQKTNDPDPSWKFSTLNSVQLQTANLQALSHPGKCQSFHSETVPQNVSNTHNQSIPPLPIPINMQKPITIPLSRNQEPPEQKDIKDTPLPSSKHTFIIGQPSVEQIGPPAPKIYSQPYLFQMEQSQSQITNARPNPPIEPVTFSEDNGQQTAGPSFMAGKVPTANQQNQQAAIKSQENYDKGIEDTVWATSKVVCTYCNSRIVESTLNLNCQCPYHLDCLKNMVEETLKRGQAVSRCVKCNHSSKINVNYLKGGLLSDQQDYRLECWKPKCYIELREGTIRRFFVQQLKQLINNSAHLLPQEAIRIYKEHS